MIDASRPLIQERDHVHAALAEQLYGERRFDRAILQVGEDIGHLKQHGFGGLHAAIGVLDGNSQGIEHLRPVADACIGLGDVL